MLLCVVCGHKSLDSACLSSASKTNDQEPYGPSLSLFAPFCHRYRVVTPLHTCSSVERLPIDREMFLCLFATLALLGQALCLVGYHIHTHLEAYCDLSESYDLFFETSQSRPPFANLLITPTFQSYTIETASAPSSMQARADDACSD
ncbi:uncharacterized protein L969DRAFT_84754 [Mixia osmundae IAM 14324]|uniref:uncharacterized protein n=1 Tax=Mixia osmundae (strain CBS 9802 / IAM 14324 / JCM 22182 / KY 12970) TaxID=764103 RepID=UPI0004A5469E|nr:uncharacterized protein L969DRAFT_84754 [Mixia osmundae IAM 14324]KEI42866.1 hypothetical protein L969DRAFT_84754 [Mixia osmundae IAM 14324]